MAKLLTHHIASITELREPQKVLDAAGGEPVAILKNSKLVGYFVPREALEDVDTHRATSDQIATAFESRLEVTQPIYDYLRDK